MADIEGLRIKGMMIASLKRRFENGGRHLHSSSCIHNLPPVEQIELRGKTVEWWMQMVGIMPVQITSDQWEAPPVTAESDDAGGPR